MPTRAPRRSGHLAGVALAALALAGCGPAGPSPTPIATSAAATTSPAAGSPAASPDGSATPAPTAGITANLRLDVVASGLQSPLDVIATDDGTGRLLIAEQAGRIQVIENGAMLPAPLLDITDRISSGGERGLLGIALHPDFPTDPRIFVDYTDLDGNTVVSSFTPTLDADVFDPASEQILLQVEQPFANHNGGALAFGQDGMLYIALGDGGSGGDPMGNGQKLDTLLAKILRIDVDVSTDQAPRYGIPPDNPFADEANGARPEIWLYGLRNPWRIRFDQATGDLWIGDVGQGAWEEIDAVRGGQGGLDLGWNIMEGFHCYDPPEGCDQTGLTLPIAEYGHDLGCAVVGGVVVHDPTIPSIDGRYIFSDNCSGNVWLLDATGNERREPVLALESGRNISAINQDGSGAVYLTDLGRGELLRVADAGS